MNGSNTTNGNTVVRTYGGIEIEQRQADGYLNATAMCKANGKQWSHYWALDGTAEFIQVLVESTGKAFDSLVQMRSGRGGGTYIHPKLAIHLAMWLSPEFSLQVTDWVYSILTTGTASLKPASKIEALIATLQQMHELECRQREQDEQVRLAREASLAALGRAEEAHERADAACHIQDCNYGHFTVLGFSRTLGLRISKEEAARIGRILSKQMRLAGVAPQAVSDGRYGRVNSYPEAMLESFFDTYGE